MQKTYKEPLRYTVGKDLEPVQYQEILTKIADWFVESRSSKEPALLAKQLVEQCLEGKTLDGRPWFAAASSTLAARIRIKCQYDIDKMEPLREAGVKQRTKKANEKRAKDRKLRGKQEVELFPEEIRRELQQNATFGDNPNIFFTQEEHRKWEEIKESYIAQFAELSTVNASAELAMLCDLHIQWDRLRMKANKGIKIDPTVSQGITKQMADLKKMLGIHPDQIKNQLKNKGELTIGAAVARLDDLNWKELRQRFWIEELIQLWMMYHTPRADGNGYQLDEIGLFGLTKSKVVTCPTCNTVHFAGLDIKEIHNYLVSKGHVVPLTPEERAYISPESGNAQAEDPDRATAVTG